jgi:hypothetical protein
MTDGFRQFAEPDRKPWNLGIIIAYKNISIIEMNMGSVYERGIKE